MTQAEFLEIFKDIIQTDSPLTMDMPLKGIEEWDSMAVMAVIAYFDVKLGIKLVFDDFQHMCIVKDVAAHVPHMEA